MERIPPDLAPGPLLAEHVQRYKWAGARVKTGEVVLDAACGYGLAEDLGYLGRAGKWIGVDRFPDRATIVADLETWKPDFDFDVFLGLETIEHLEDYSAYVRAAKQARRLILISTPIIPTVHTNAFHRQDFTVADVVEIFTDDDWRLVEYAEQLAIYGLFVFARR